MSRSPFHRFPASLLLFVCLLFLLPPLVPPALAGHLPTQGCQTGDCDDPPPEKKPRKCETGDCCEGGGSGGGKVDFWSGQEFFTHADLDLSGLIPIRVQRLYDSRADFDSALGYGWALNYFIRLYEYSDGSVVIRKNCGYRGSFVLSAGAYQTPVGMTGSLVKNAGGWTYTLKEGDRWEFDTAGKLTAIVSRRGPRLVMTYDTGGKLPLIGVSPYAVDPNTPKEIAKEYRLLKIEERDSSGTPTGRFVSLSYDGSTGRLTGLTDSAGRSVSYTHDSKGNLTKAALPGGAALSYAYADPADPHNATTLDHSACSSCSLGGKIELVYDDKDRVIREERGNHTMDISYDTPYAKTTVTETTRDEGGAVLSTAKTVWEFNADGAPLKMTDPLGVQKVYVRDSRLNVTRTELYEAATLKYAEDRTYDAVGNTLTKTESSGTSLARTTTYTYNAGNQVTSITVKSVVNPLQNKQTVFEYDAKGNLTKRTETGLLGDGTPYSYVTTYAYTPNGQIASIDGPRTDASDVTSFSYDAQGRLLSVTQPASLVTAYSSYTQTGKPQTVTDPNGVAAAYAYDSLDRVKTVTIAGDTTAYSYTPSGKIASITLPKGNAVAYSYDSLDRLSQIKDALGNGIDYQYDSAGNRVKEEIKDSAGALQKTLSFQHDALNRLTRIVNPDSTYTEYGYDARGNRVSLRNPNLQLSTFNYDSLNRLTSVIQPGSIATSYAYTTQDGLASVTDANGHVTTYNYDDMGRVYRVTSPDTGTTTYSYDPAGNLTAKTDAKGVITAYQYDALNRLTKIDFPADGDVIYVYDSCPNGKGRLCGTTDQAGTASYEYSAKGELTKETKVIQGRTYVTSYSFDKNGNLSSITYPSGRVVSYTLDAADRVTGVTTTPYRGTAQTAASSIAHKPYGGIASMTYGSGLARSVGYDQQYRINSIVTGAVQNVAYTHDPNGNITKITDNLNPTKNKNFSYDALDRLTGGTGPWGTLSWTYDPVGNRQTQVENGATSTYSYQTGTNKLAGVTGPSPLTFSLDSNGNTTSENAKTYTFNQNNRLIKASEASTLGEYSYNANGQRATKAAGGSTAVFHHDQAGQLIAETTSAGATIAEYVWLENQPLAKVDSGGPRYIHPDHLGTPQVMTDATKATVWQVESKPFGDGASIAGSGVLNLRFPGQYYDSETGLHQNWFRDYQPKVGRYIEADPILGFETQLVRHIRRQERRVGGAAGLLAQQAFSYQVLRMARIYVYASNSPHRRIDPEGLSDLCVEKCHVILSVPLCGPPVIAAGCFRIPVAVLCRQMLETICQLHCHEDKRPDPDDWDNAVNPDNN